MCYSMQEQCCQLVPSVALVVHGYLHNNGIRLLLLMPQEIITISTDTLQGYDDKIKSFYEEHIHSDEEIRFVLDGRGGRLAPCTSEPNTCPSAAPPARHIAVQPCTPCSSSR